MLGLLETSDEQNIDLVKCREDINRLKTENDSKTALVSS